MRKYQIVEITENLNHAGTKATADFAKIADECGYERVKIRMNTTRTGKIAKLQRQIGYYFDWEKCFKSIQSHSVVILQHPFHHQQFTRDSVLLRLKQKKNVKFISIIHDVEELRQFRYNNYYKNEFDFMLHIADVIVVHNEKMKEFFLSKGVSESRLVSLEIFDYLQEELDKKEVVFSKAITVAGNLDTTKCGYVGALDQIQGVDIHLYGPNFDSKLKDNANIIYHGVLSPDKVPEVLTAGFGLVWDGDGIRGGMGQAGQYVRYNNPHKLSLYLSSGMPVVIWKEAAEAEFVEKNGVGILIDSLDELSDIIPKMKEEEFIEIRNNVKVISDKLLHGEFGKKSILEAEKIMGV